MLKLSKEIQSLFSASTQISSFKRTVEELVYNSLDADSTSIAIRVNVEDQTIQVIDNGLGISKTNFELLGQRYATSKYVDLSTLKSAPNKYGYRGQSLASIIDVSEKVYITSRCHGSEETWAKSFCKGKEQKLSETAQRPSKGTTVEIKGFLYNLKIQRNTIDELNELNDIKSFLEQLSLVHNNISLSLRNDSKNEIIFKLHKNRNIYQTLSSVFEIEEKDVQQITVQKNQYKVAAYIGKRDINKNLKHWIYLNRKILNNSKIHQIINENFAKELKLNFQPKRKVKTNKIYDKEEEVSNKNSIPFYFILITCPYYDYDVTYTSKKTTVEFKNWEQINKLIERLAKVYTGDINLKEIKPIQNQTNPVEKTSESREKVKKIMEKILGSKARKPGVSQMQNGVKGKLVKRKYKRNDRKTQQLTLSKIIKEKITKEDNVKKNTVELNDHNFLPSGTTKINNDDVHQKVEKETANDKPKKDKITTKPSAKTSKYTKKMNEKVKTCKINTPHKHHNYKLGNGKNETKYVKCIKQKNEFHKQGGKEKKGKGKKPKKERKKCIIEKVDPLVKHFQEDPTGSIKQRCEFLDKHVDGLISYNRQPKRKIFVNETIQYSNIVRNNKNYSVRKKIGEIVIHEYVPKPPQSSPFSFDGRNWNNAQKNPCKTSYDLIRTILRTQEITEKKNSNTSFAEYNDPGEPIFTQAYAYNNRNKSKYTPLDESPKNNNLPRLTYDSHNYNNTELNGDIAVDTDIPQKKARKFISTYSKDNFVVPQIKEQPKRKKYKAASNCLKMFTERFENFNESRFNIDFTQSNDRLRQSHADEVPSIFNYEIPRYEQEHFTVENNDKTKFSQFDCTFTNHVSKGFHRHCSESDNVCRRSKDNVEYSPDLIDLTSMENVLQKEEKGTYTIEKNDFTRFDCTYTLSDQRFYVTNQQNKFDNNIYNNIASDGIISNTLDITNIASMENVIQNKNICEINRSNNMNVVFISNSQEQAKNNDSPQLSFNPVNVCETVHSDNNDGVFEERRSHSRLWNDSLFNEDFDIDSFLGDRNAQTQRNFMTTNELLDEINGNFEQNTNINENITARNVTATLNGNNEKMNVNMSNAASRQGNDKLSVNMNEGNNFTFRNRLRFLPKGMSQIFENCQSKNLCDYDRLLDEEYYEKTIYNDFANVVQMNTEIFEPNVQNVHELTTKAIEKVNNRLNRDGASLIFNGQSLKQATVLGQIDDKFIAAKVLGRTQDSIEMLEYLVLFDQHAVHERIRLENNLADYFNGEQWKSITLDEITIKLSKDEILYLHNYRDKFIQLGLQWSILNNGKLSLTSIPEAILGKNPRQVEVVMKAVKNLITEEINSIRTQSGCISLYPKSIMDLVFSEACRYAIKFGDKLSKTECIDLLNSLSECKTPFQCAHGRPVMAVLMDIKYKKNSYKVNLSNVSKWKK